LSQNPVYEDIKDIHNDLNAISDSNREDVGKNEINLNINSSYGCMKMASL